MPKLSQFTVKSIQYKPVGIKDSQKTYIFCSEKTLKILILTKIQKRHNKLQCGQQFENIENIYWDNLFMGPVFLMRAHVKTNKTKFFANNIYFFKLNHVICQIQAARC